MKRDLLFQRRVDLRLTQAELAKQAGIDRSAYTRIELGDRNPSVDIAIRIARVLKCRVEDIFLPCDVTKQHNEALAK